MKIDLKLLEKMSELELRRYAGELHVLNGRNLGIYRALRVQPVEMKVLPVRGACNHRLYQICANAEGKYSRFDDLRQAIVNELVKKAQGPGWNLLPVLFNGIFVGEPEDFGRYRADPKIKPLYPVRGFGTKVGEVNFLSTEISL